jgi:hypothetical protein
MNGLSLSNEYRNRDAELQRAFGCSQGDLILGGNDGDTKGPKRLRLVAEISKGLYELAAYSDYGGRHENHLPAAG